MDLSPPKGIAWELVNGNNLSPRKSVAQDTVYREVGNSNVIKKNGPPRTTYNSQTPQNQTQRQ